MENSYVCFLSRFLVTYFPDLVNRSPSLSFLLTPGTMTSIMLELKLPEIDITGIIFKIKSFASVK